MEPTVANVGRVLCLEISNCAMNIVLSPSCQRVTTGRKHLNEEGEAKNFKEIIKTSIRSLFGEDNYITDLQ